MYARHTFVLLATTTGPQYTPHSHRDRRETARTDSAATQRQAALRGTIRHEHAPHNNGTARGGIRPRTYNSTCVQLVLVLVHVHVQHE